MKRHAFDFTSFIFGVVLATAAAGFLVADQLSWDIDGRWVLPVALILLGVAGVAGALSGLRSARTTEGERDGDADHESDGEEAASAPTGGSASSETLSSS